MRTSVSTLIGLAAITAIAGLGLPAIAAPATPARTALAMSALGDLAPYRTIASDTLAIVDKGDLPAARVRIKDLETLWDKAEATMKPKDPTTWGKLDKSIDGALNALRSYTPQKAECATALKALIANMDEANKA